VSEFDLGPLSTSNCVKGEQRPGGTLVRLDQRGFQAGDDKEAKDASSFIPICAGLDVHKEVGDGVGRAVHGRKHCQKGK